MEKITINFISYFFTIKFITKSAAIAFVILVNTVSIADVISLHVITEVSGTLFKYLNFSQIHV